MHTITPCQRKISDRFPVASFVVNLSPNRLFEIVCTTDPQLLHSEYRGRRDAHNFFTSRSAGLLRAPAGHATYLVPAEQLKRFAGRPRIYYALASYDSPRGDDLKLSIAPSALGTADAVPSIQLSMDFTGRSLDRSRIRGAPRDGKYGGSAAVLTWGGDAMARRVEVKEPPPDYDDGFSPDLWKGAARSTAMPAVAAARAPDPHEPPPPDSLRDEAGLGEAYGRPTRTPARATPPAGANRSLPPEEPEPVGFEDALTLRTAGAVYARVVESPVVQAPVYGRPAIQAAPGYPPIHAVAEPPGVEHGRDRAHATQPATYAGAPCVAEPPGVEHGRDGAHATQPATYAGAPRVAEPPGAEDGRELVRGPVSAHAAHTFGAATHGYGRGDAGAEPPGAEDPRELVRHGAPGAAAIPELPVADAAAHLAAMTSSAPDPGVPGRGVDDGWIEDDDEADLVSSAGEGDGQPLTVRRKFELLLPVAAFESGARRYSAVLGSVEHDDPSHAASGRVHHGLHWGLVLFSQRSGALGEVLIACERRDSARFLQTFGASQASRLIHVTTASSPDGRLAPVGGALLWTRSWIDRFREAGRVPAFQAAQNEVAIEHYFDRNLGFAGALGLMTDRALAMVFDRAVHMGIAGGRQWILQAVSPISDDARRAAALQALGHADVAAFQRASGLAATGRFGTQTHAALLRAVRVLGAQAPFASPTVADMLDKLVAAAAGRRFERRVGELRSLAAYSDAVQRVI
jgi:hypothetical protein